MKARIGNGILFLSLIITSALLLPANAFAAGKTADHAKAAKLRMQVYVDIPSVWHPFLQQNIQDAFTGYVQDVFQRRGYKGQIDEVTDLSFVKKGEPLLSITLIDWRIDRTGSVECTFTASIKNGQKEKNLGILMSNSLFGFGPVNDRWEISNALEDAAHTAIGDMYDRLIKTNMVPGLTEKKSH